MQLNLIKKPENEILSLEETKNYLRIDHDFDDTLIANTVKSTREALESIIQKSILKQTWEYILDDCSVCNFDSGESSYPNIFCDVIRIPLPKPPIMKVISVIIGTEKQEDEEYSVKKVNNTFFLCVNYKKSVG